MFCPKCGTQLRDGSTFCSGCGSQLNASGLRPAQAPRSRPLDYGRFGDAAYRETADRGLYETGYRSYTPPKMNKLNSVATRLSSTSVTGGLSLLDVLRTVAGALACLMMLLRWLKVPSSNWAAIGAPGSANIPDIKFSLWTLGDGFSLIREYPMLNQQILGNIDSGVQSLINNLVSASWLFSVFMIIGIAAFTLIVIGTTASFFGKKAGKFQLCGFAMSTLFCIITLAIVAIVDSTCMNELIKQFGTLGNYANVNLYSMHILVVTEAPIICLIFSITGFALSVLSMLNKRSIR